MKRVLVTIILVGFLLVPSGSQANDATGCEGLEAFRAELFPVGQRWADELSALGISGADWDPLALSSDDWRAYAVVSLEIHRALKEIDAPTWAADWLEVRIDTTAVQEQVGKAVAEGGVMIILGFSDSLETLDKRDEETREAAIAHCPDFAQFAYDWDALDGVVEGTPVATPVN